MTKDRPPSKKTRGRRTQDEDDEEEGGWKSWLRDVAIAVIIMVVILAAIYAYTQVWPPLVVVESSSMQHSDSTSYLGVIDTGDLVFVQAAPSRTDVVTYVQGRASGYSTYGDYGDVIIFRLYYSPGETPIIHRAIMYVIPNGSNVDVPDLSLLPMREWGGTDAGGQPTHVPYGLQSVWINGMGFDHNLNITFDFAELHSFLGRGPGYLTMGDHNAPRYDLTWFPTRGDIIGRARGEIPWFGLIKLLLSPTSQCAHQWGDPCAAQNSWNDLALSLAFLVALPFIVEAAGWAWGKYAWPRIRPLLPWKREAEETKAEAPPEPMEDEEPPDEPKEGSSEP
jgi:signal peptidase